MEKIKSTGKKNLAPPNIGGIKNAPCQVCIILYATSDYMTYSIYSSGELPNTNTYL